MFKFTFYILFIFFLSLFLSFFNKHNLKTIWCMQILCCVICIWRWAAKTILVLANAFICSVKSYSGVSSKSYFVASNKTCLVLGSWFRNPPKKNRNYIGGKWFCKNFFQVGMKLKNPRNKAEIRNLKNPTPLQNHAGPLFGLQCNALASLVCFVTYTTKWTKDTNALRWRPYRGGQRCSVVGKVLEISYLCLVSVFFWLHPYLKWIIFRKLFLYYVSKCVYRKTSRD